MAHTILLLRNRRAEALYYNLDGAVGRGPLCRNRKDDVMLIQALFQLFYYEKRQGGGLYTPPNLDQTSIQVDGKLGSNTLLHIEHFLNQLIKLKSVYMINDRKIDPIPKDSRLVTTSKNGGVRLRSLVYLQNAIGVFQSRETAITLRSDFPLELRSSVEQRRMHAIPN